MLPWMGPLRNSFCNGFHDTLSCTPHFISAAGGRARCARSFDSFGSFAAQICEERPERLAAIALGDGASLGQLRRLARGRAVAPAQVIFLHAGDEIAKEGQAEKGAGRDVRLNRNRTVGTPRSRSA